MIEPNLGLGILNEMFSIKGNELSEIDLEANSKEMEEKYLVTDEEE